MSQENIEVGRRMLAAVAAGQPEQALEFFDPKVVVDATRNVFNPGTYVGIDGLERCKRILARYGKKSTWSRSDSLTPVIAW